MSFVVAVAAAAGDRHGGRGHAVRDGSEVGADVVDSDQVASSINPVSANAPGRRAASRPLFRVNQVREGPLKMSQCASLPVRYTLADDWKLRMASASLSWVSNTVSNLVMASRSVIRLVRLRSLRLPP